jgi:hypothetical protein
MRSKFPWFWIVQFFALAMLSFANLFYPYGVLEYYRGRLAPQEVDRPSEALNSWVMGLEELPVPNTLIREFFSDHNEIAHEDEDVWTPHDFSSRHRSAWISPSPPGDRRPIVRVCQDSRERILRARTAVPDRDAVFHPDSRR